MAVAAGLLAACQDAGRLTDVERQVIEQRDQHRALARRVDDLETPRWWCTIAGCRRARADCDLAAAQLAASTQAQPQPIARAECKQARIAWCVEARCWATLRQCVDVETRPEACAGVE